MMFLAFGLDSVNTQGQMPRGRYASSCHVYQPLQAGLPFRLFMFEHACEAVGQIVAIFLVSVDELGDVGFADFLRMRDEGWGNNFGERSDSLAELLAESATDFVKIRELEGKPFTLEG